VGREQVWPKMYLVPALLITLALDGGLGWDWDRPVPGKFSFWKPDLFGANPSSKKERVSASSSWIDSWMDSWRWSISQRIACENEMNVSEDMCKSQAKKTVCGSNRKEYVNQCFLYRDHCKTARKITWAHDGPCRDADEVDCADHEAHHCRGCTWNRDKSACGDNDCRWVEGHCELEEELVECGGGYAHQCSDCKKLGFTCDEDCEIEDGKCVHGGSCFSGSSTVETEERGKIPIGNLRLGDNVLTYTHGKGVHYTEFLGWLDRDANADGKFLKISTNSTSIALTGSHLIFRLSADVGLESVFADQLEEGDRLVSWKGEETVVGVEAAREKGIWAPLTMEGTLLVDGLLASSYASFSHHASDLLLAPVKMFPRLLLDDQQSQHQDGCRQVIKLMKKMGTAAGFRERNQAKNENSFSPNEQLAAAAAGFSKPVEL